MAKVGPEEAIPGHEGRGRGADRERAHRSKDWHGQVLRDLGPILPARQKPCKLAGLFQARECETAGAFAISAVDDILAGDVVDSPLAQRVLQQVRPWIEPAQSYEKHQLGLGSVFLNGLRFTWAMALLADAAVLLRARALLEGPAPRPLLAGLMPVQLSLELGAGVAMSVLPATNLNPHNHQ